MDFEMLDEVYPWQRELADRIFEAVKNGDRLVLVGHGRRGGMAWVRKEVERRLEADHGDR